MAKAKWCRFLLVLAFVLLALRPSWAEARPPLPATFYGLIALPGGTPPEGTPVTAWAGDLQCGEGKVRHYQGSAVYLLHLRGDDPDTAAVEGAREGALVSFRVGNAWVKRAAIWRSGESQRLDLCIAFSPMYLPLVLKGGSR